MISLNRFNKSNIILRICFGPTASCSSGNVVSGGHLSRRCRMLKRAISLWILDVHYETRCCTGCRILGAALLRSNEIPEICLAANTPVVRTVQGGTASFSTALFFLSSLGLWITRRLQDGGGGGASRKK